MPEYSIIFLKPLLDLQGEVDSNIIRVRDFNSSFSSMVRSSRPKNYKETLKLHGTTHQMHLTNIDKTWQAKAADCTFFSSANETVSRIGHILGHRTNHGKFKIIEIKTKIGEEINTITIFKNTKTQQNKEEVCPEDKVGQEKNEIKIINKSKKKKSHHNQYHKKYHLRIIMNNYVPIGKPRRNV